MLRFQTGYKVTGYYSSIQRQATGFPDITKTSWQNVCITTCSPNTRITMNENEKQQISTHQDTGI